MNRFKTLEPSNGVPCLRLLALAIHRRAYLVTGDDDLLVLSDDFPILTPAQFASKLRESR